MHLSQSQANPGCETSDIYQLNDLDGHSLNYQGSIFC